MGRGKRYNGYLRSTFTFNGKKYYVYARTQDELIEKKIAKKKELEAGNEELYNPTLNQYYDIFTEIRKKERSENTIRAQRQQYKMISDVKMKNDRPFGEMHIKDITRRDIEYTRQALIDVGKTPEHINICYKHLNHVFNCAVLDDTIIKNPCKALVPLKRSTAPIVKTKHRALTEDETKRFFESAEIRNSYYINIFRLMIKSGMRMGEVCALYPADIDKKNGFIYVRKTVTRDEIGNYIIGDSTKTTNGVRDIPLTPDLISIIKAQEDLNRMIFGLKWSGLLFQTLDGSIIRDYTINREIERICKDAGIKKITSHAFRDTFATRFMEQRPHDFKILSEILGHKDISITLNLYTHIMTENKVNAMNDVLINIS